MKYLHLAEANKLGFIGKTRCLKREKTKPSKTKNPNKTSYSEEDLTDMFICMQDGRPFLVIAYEPNLHSVLWLWLLIGWFSPVGWQMSQAQETAAVGCCPSPCEDRLTRTGHACALWVSTFVEIWRISSEMAYADSFFQNLAISLRLSSKNVYQILLWAVHKRRFCRLCSLITQMKSLQITNLFYQKRTRR